MKTDVIRVTGSGADMALALAEAEKMAAYRELSPQNAVSLRLLTEEMMALMRAVTGGAEGEFWIENSGGVSELHLRVNTVPDSSLRRQLLDASTSGKNEASRGLMGRLRSFFMPSGDAPAFPGGFMPGSSQQMYGGLVWSMEEYRSTLRRYRAQHGGGAEEAWDELEKSVVAHVADDVRVFIRGRMTEMIILKKMVEASPDGAKSWIVRIDNRGKGFGRAVAEARRMAGTAGLSAEDSMHLQLLAEEMLSMARSVTGELEASFWVEYRGSRFDLYMTTRAVLDKEKRHQLITSSSERRNEITGTFLGRLRDAFEEAMAADTERVCLSRSSGAREAGPAGGAAQEQGWDRFERSILLKLADDVKVAIRGGEVRLTVSRDFGKPS